MLFSIHLIPSIAAILCYGADLAVGQVPSRLQSILSNTHNSKEYGYPTDITRDLHPVSYLKPDSSYVLYKELKRH